METMKARVEFLSQMLMLVCQSLALCQSVPGYTWLCVYYSIVCLDTHKVVKIDVTLFEQILLFAF